MEISFTWKTDTLSTMLERLKNLKRSGILAKAMYREAIKIQRQAQKLAPSNDSHLRNSITTAYPEAHGDGLVCRIGSPQLYAPFIEFGTGLFGPHKQMIVSPTGGLMKWKGLANRATVTVTKLRRTRTGQIVFRNVQKPVSQKQQFFSKYQTKGRPATPFLKPAIDQGGPQWAENIMKALIKLAKGSA